MLKKSQMQPKRISKLRRQKLELRIKAKIEADPVVKARNERFVSQFSAPKKNCYDPFLV